MRPTKPFRALFDVEPPVPAVKFSLCAYCCRAEPLGDQAPVKQTGQEAA